MKRMLAITLSLLLILAAFSGCTERRNPSDSAVESTSEIRSSDLPEVQGHENVLNEYYAPNYDSQNSFNSVLFMDILKCDGYYRNGEIDRNYNTDNISCVVNITPESITDEKNDIALFLVKDGYHCFLMKDQKIYRYDTTGGYHLQLCLWDYDGNGTKDLVSYHSFGSGIPYLGVSILDLSSMENLSVITRNLLSSGGFSFEFKNGIVYIDGEELTYSDGQFHCNSFMIGTNE